jgi:hypothetical protein
MKRHLLWLVVILAFSSMPAWSEGLPKAKTDIPERYSMLTTAPIQRSISSNVIKAVCTGKNTCCCRAGSQIFCSTPDTCSRAGGVCSAGCN